MRQIFPNIQKSTHKIGFLYNQTDFRANIMGAFTDAPDKINLLFKEIVYQYYNDNYKMQETKCIIWVWIESM